MKKRIDPGRSVVFPRPPSVPPGDAPRTGHHGRAGGAGHRLLWGANRPRPGELSH